MKLQRIELKNIGKFKQLHLDFSIQPNTPITVLLGDQNSGKTSILKQIFHGLSWFSNRHKDPRSSGILMTDLDIKHEASNATMLLEVKYPAELGNVASDAEVKPRPDHMCRWKLQKTRQNNSSIAISASELSELEALINRYQKQVLEDPLFSIPCIAYYPVERFIYEVNIQGKNVASTLAPLHNAYDLTTVNFTTFNKFFEWFREVHDVENAQAAKLFKQYLNPQQRFSQPEDLQGAMSAIEQAYRLASQRSISSLRAALSNILPEVQDIDLEYTPKLNLMVQHNGQMTPFLQLPQATRIWIGLIGDLVRRLCLLNPESLYPCLEGDGIVLIDAIDLLLDPPHLQQILPRLQRTFPRLQFIVSSHNLDLLENTEHIQCFQLINETVQHINIPEHQKKLAQIYQELNAPITETPESELPTVVTDAQHLLNTIQALTKEEQAFILEQLQQFPTLKDR